MNESNLSVKLKRLTPIAVKEAAKKAFTLTDPYFVRRYKNKMHFGPPIPPITLRARVGGAGIEKFVEGGRVCAVALEQALKKIGRTFDDFGAILDFGCGCGRTIQHIFTEGRAAKIHGCDVDYTAIDWMNKNYPHSEFRANKFDPPLPYEAESFDLLYSISIFTHLNERKQQEWIQEIRRVLKVGGIALVTIQSELGLEQFTSERIPVSAVILQHLRKASDSRVLEKEGFLYDPYEHFAPDSSAFPGIEDTYGVTFQTHDYTRKNWSRHFEVLGIEAGTVDNLQDVVILKKV